MLENLFCLIFLKLNQSLQKISLPEDENENVYTKNIHLWHPVANKMNKPFNEHDYVEYINS